MKKVFAGLLLPVLVAAAMPPSAAGDGWTQLYNGRDFSGWQVLRGSLGGWSARPDRISFEGKEGGCLSTIRSYSDFELQFEYRLAPGGNTGVGIRFPKDGWPSTDGFEIQILDDDHPRYAGLKPEQLNGTIYTHLLPKLKAHRPAGEWNSMMVRCRGPHVVVRLNGQEIHNFNMKDYPQSYGKGKLPLSERPLCGLIGFPSHGDPVDFRNIRIRELTAK